MACCWRGPTTIWLMIKRLHLLQRMEILSFTYAIKFWTPGFLSVFTIWEDTFRRWNNFSKKQLTLSELHFTDQALSKRKADKSAAGYKGSKRQGGFYFQDQTAQCWIVVQLWKYLLTQPCPWWVQTRGRAKVRVLIECLCFLSQINTFKATSFLNNKMP